MAIRTEVSQVLDAPADAVYDAIADYATRHPRILPRPEFESLVVEKGGRGAGTRIRVGMKVMGARSETVLDVTEPQPGRLLREATPDGALATTFTVEPLEGGARSRVTIATEWARKPGLRGWVESKVNPRVAAKLYRRELTLLEAEARRGGPLGDDPRGPGKGF